MRKVITNLLMSCVVLYFTGCAQDEQSTAANADSTKMVVSETAGNNTETTASAPSDQLAAATVAEPLNAATTTKTTATTEPSTPTNGEATAKQAKESSQKVETETSDTYVSSANERVIASPSTSERTVVEKPAASPKPITKTPETLAVVENKAAEGPTRGMAPTKSSKSAAAMKVDNPTYDFGSIHEGEEVAHTFTIRNTGNADLTIDNAKPSCGCTIPDIPLEPIRPGESSTIKVRFNSNNKIGPQRKTIDVMTNAGVYQISLVGTVYPKTEEKLGN